MQIARRDYLLAGSCAHEPPSSALSLVGAELVKFTEHLVEFTEHDEGLLAHLQDRRGISTLCARYVIAADGGRGQLREQLGIGRHGKPVDGAAVSASARTCGPHYAAATSMRSFMARHAGAWPGPCCARMFSDFGAPLASCPIVISAVSSLCSRASSARTGVHAGQPAQLVLGRLAVLAGGLLRALAKLRRGGLGVLTKLRGVALCLGEELVGLLARRAELVGDLLLALLQLDLPAGVHGAAETLVAAGVRDRCEVVTGDFFTAVPEGGDGYLLKSVVDDWDDERAVAILRNCRRAAGSSGTVLVVEPVLPARVESAAVIGDVLSDINMLVNIGGKERTAEQFEELFRAAGLQLDEIVPVGAGYHVVAGRPG